MVASFILNSLSVIILVFWYSSGWYSAPARQISCNSNKCVFNLFRAAVSVVFYLAVLFRNVILLLYCHSLSTCIINVLFLNKWRWDEMRLAVVSYIPIWRIPAILDFDWSDNFTTPIIIIIIINIDQSPQFRYSIFLSVYRNWWKSLVFSTEMTKKSRPIRLPLPSWIYFRLWFGICQDGHPLQLHKFNANWAIFGRITDTAFSCFPIWRPSAVLDFQWSEILPYWHFCASVFYPHTKFGAKILFPTDIWPKLEVHSVEHIYLRQRCFDASKPRVAVSTGAQYQYVGFSPT